MVRTSDKSVAKNPRGALWAGLVAAMIFSVVWGLGRQARPVPPTADLYTHLSVARHLARGDGYLSDVAYPLSFAYPFARRLPQPLIHRMPGFGTVLLLPYLAAEGDPARTIDLVRSLQALLVILMIGMGTSALWRREARAGIPFWLILMGASPLLGFAVAWGQDEVLVGLMLLVIWLHLRRRQPPPPLFVGAMTGLMAMVRLELFWVPVLWWLALVRPAPGPGERSRRFNPAFWLMFAAATVVLVPWSLRTLDLTGQPFFTLQGVAEHAKDTRTFPGYTVYQGMDPQPLLHTIMTDPMPLARKTMRGLRFYLENLPRFLSWPWLLVLAVGALKPPVRRRDEPESPPESGLTVAVLTTLLLILFYSPFDHSLRHLLPVMPMLTWELAAFAGGTHKPESGRRTVSRSAILAIVAVAAALVFPCHLPGWESEAADAARLQPAVAAEIARVQEAGPGVIFTDYSAVPWFADRPVVWAPPDPAVRKEISSMLHREVGSPRAGR